MKKKKLNIARWIFLLCVTGVFSCIYVFLSGKIMEAGYTMEKQKKNLEELTMINKIYKARFVELTSPDNLIDILEKKGIELENPKEWCYVDIRINKNERGKISDRAEAGTK
jgi:cell division protein FtsL